QVRRPFVLLFVQPPPGVGPFRLWHPSEGWRALQRFPTGDDTGGTSSEESYAAFFRRLVGGGREPGWCPMQAGPIIDAIRRLLGPDWFASEVAATPPPPDPEWLETFHAFTTELAGGVAPLDAELAIDFPGRHQSRTRVRGTLAVPASREPSAWVLTGEVLREAALFEAFRYRFEMPPSPAEQDSLPLVFERALRPGTFQLVLKLEEVGGRRATRLVRDLEVPLVDSAPAAATAPKSAPEGPPSLRLPPPAGDLQTGTVRITAECDDPRVARVAFTLDGAPLFTRSRPPWTVELQLGSLPRAARIRALGYDRDGALLAADELLLNAAPHRFAVRLLEPREGLPSGALRVRAEVQVPEGKAIERLELFLDERRVATLWQPPWTHTLALPPAPPTYVRALAVLADGSTAEDVVLLGEEGRQSRVDVDLVELYVSAANARGRPVHDLAADELEVREEGVPQELRRFQHVTELPLHVALLVDTSASMAEELPAVQSAGLTFFRGTLRPEDRAAVLTFSEEPRLACRFTDDPVRLATALAGLSAERSTRLWDSLAFALHYFQGVPGKRALLVFSDGADRGSGFSFEQVMELAQHAGVAVYAVSFGTAAAQLLEGRRRLARVADATGGRSFVLGTAEQLAATYAAIEEDLRSQYLVAYQSSNSGEGLRRVEVAVRRPGHTARTVHGYVP
ncbi:MAG TPA: VWA domain-containing protein, partial [Thermoanaerobaculia bacterium]|nr:VWA domain-containing protein [Thermoanaerobaculia bacterium]